METKLELRRKLIRRVAAASLMTAAGGKGWIARALAAAPDAGMRRIDGSVGINGEPARAGMVVRPGDTVHTGADGTAAYVMGGNAFLQRSGSRIHFGGTAAAGVLRVLSGRLLSVFAPGPMRIETPTAVLGIRGTGCYIEAEPERVYFCLCYGEVELTPTATPQERETYRTTHHDKPLYIYRDMALPKMAVPAGVINHSDSELLLLEALVGRRPPFWRGDGTAY